MVGVWNGGVVYDVSFGLFVEKVGNFGFEKGLIFWVVYGIVGVMVV